MHALVIGASGFIGSHIVDNLIERDYEVTAILRHTSNARWVNPKAEIVRINTFKPEQIADRLAKADYFVHVAGLVKALRIRDFYRVNAEMVKIWLEACEKYCTKLKRFVLISSLAAARPSEVPIDETVPSEPVTHYGKSKRLGEIYAMKFMEKIPITIVRPPAVYGPRDTEILRYIKFIKLGIAPIVGKPTVKASLIFVSDLARAIIELMECQEAAGETFFVKNDRTPTRFEFIKAIADAMNKKPLFIRIPNPIVYIAAFLSETFAKVVGKATIFTLDKMPELLLSWNVDDSKIRKTIDFKPMYNLEDGFKLTVDWYKKVGWL